MSCVSTQIKYSKLNSPCICIVYFNNERYVASTPLRILFIINRCKTARLNPGDHFRLNAIITGNSGILWAQKIATTRAFDVAKFYQDLVNEALNIGCTVEQDPEDDTFVITTTNGWGIEGYLTVKEERGVISEMNYTGHFNKKLYNWLNREINERGKRRVLRGEF